MESRRLKVSIESLMVMILMIAFAIAVSLMITQGSQVFNESLEQKESDENLRIAMSYMNMRIKQNDSSESVLFKQEAVEGNDAIILVHHGEELGFKSYIYYTDGYLYECYTDEEPTMEMSTAIIASEGIRFEYTLDQHTIKVHYVVKVKEKQQEIEQLITLRSN